MSSVTEEYQRAVRALKFATAPGFRLGPIDPLTGLPPESQLHAVADSLAPGTERKVPLSNLVYGAQPVGEFGLGTGPTDESYSGDYPQLEVPEQETALKDKPTYLHLYFSWNIDDIDLPCHRDAFEENLYGYGFGCGLWRAIIAISPLPVTSTAAGGTRSSSVPPLKIIALDPVVQSSSGNGVWFPSVVRDPETEKIYIAANYQYGGGLAQYVFWGESADGLTLGNEEGSMVPFATYGQARFPGWSRDHTQIAITELELDTEDVLADENFLQNVRILDLDSSLKVTGNTLISQDSEFFQNESADAASMSGGCFIYQAAASVTGGSATLLACPDGSGYSLNTFTGGTGRVNYDNVFASADTSPKTTIPTRCGHPGPTHNSEWVSCSDNAIYYFGAAPDGGGAGSADELFLYTPGSAAGLFVDISPAVRERDIEFEANVRGTPYTCSRIFQVYLSWGDTDNIMVFTGMCAKEYADGSLGDDFETKEIVVRSKLFMVFSELPNQIDTTDSIPNHIVDIGKMIAEYAIAHQKISTDEAYKLDYCTADFFTTDSLAHATSPSSDGQ